MSGDVGYRPLHHTDGKLEFTTLVLIVLRLMCPVQWMAKSRVTAEHTSACRFFMGTACAGDIESI